MSMFVAIIGGLEEIHKCMKFEDMVYGYLGRRTLMEEQEDIERKRKEMLSFIDNKQGYLCNFNS